MTSWPNSDVQIASFGVTTGTIASLGANWRGIPVEVGGRGKVVRLWGIHHHVYNIRPNAAVALWISALSSNPDHDGSLDLGLDELCLSPAIYGRHIHADEQPATTAGFIESAYTPLYGIIRPRRQIWVTYLINFEWTRRLGIEVYYTEVRGSRTSIDAVDRKFGKYRRS